MPSSSSSHSSSSRSSLSHLNGGLRVCGCRWRVASDDLVFPAWLEFFYRLCGLAVLAGVLIYEELSPSTCAPQFHLDLYLIVAIVLFASLLLNNALLGFHSASGAIWDANVTARRHVSLLVHANVVLTIGELLWALTGSIFVVRGLVQQCMMEPGTLTLLAAQADRVPIYLVLLIVVCTWIGLGLKVLLSCLSFKTVSGFPNDGQVEDVVERGQQHAHAHQDVVMDQAPGCMSKLFSVCMKKSQLTFFKDVAGVLSDVFDDNSFVPTDIASALLLIHVKQTEQQQEQQQQQLNMQEEPSVVPVRVAYNNLAATPQKTSLARLATVESFSDPVRVGAAGDDSDNDDDENWKNPELVYHYMQYAGAAYGYTWFLMRNTLLNLYKMYPHLACCGCCACCHGDREYIEKDNCLGCNTAALKAMLPHLDDDCLVHVSFKNRLSEVPYFVAVDHKYKKIVISIRGTLSLEDALTDLKARPESMGGFHQSLEHVYAHSGMLKAAEYVYEELRGDKHILDRALSYYDDYTLVVTGHSLGAGTAALLAFMLRVHHPSTLCYAYSPPGGLLSEAAARVSESFTLSVIVGQDLVPRLSFQSLSLLKAEMKRELRQCNLPKYQVLASGLCACFVADWKKHLRYNTPEPEPEPKRKQQPTTRGGRKNSAESDNSNVPILEAHERVHTGEKSPRSRYESLSEVMIRTKTEAGRLAEAEAASAAAAQPKLVLPGVIWHLEPLGDEKAAGGDAASLEYSLCRKTSKDFQQILVSPKMMADHLPNTVLDVLKSVKTSNGLVRDNN